MKRILAICLLFVLPAIGQDADFRRQVQTTTLTRQLLQKATAQQIRELLNVEEGGTFISIVTNVISVTTNNTIVGAVELTSTYRKLSNEAIPLTLRQSSDKVFAGFVRPSEAFDPVSGTHVASNTVRSIPLAFGSMLGSALLIERQGTNFPYPGLPAGELNPVRTTVSTNNIPGPYGFTIPAIAYTDTAGTNTHYAYFDQGPANSAPVHFGVLVKPNNLTNLTYDLQIAAATNAGWNFTMRATLTGEDALPQLTYITNGPVTFHDGAWVKMSNGWWYGWVNVTLSDASTARAYVAPAGFLTYAGITTSPSFYTAGYNYSSTPAAFETPIYQLSKSSGAQIRSKPQDNYAYEIKSTVNSASGTLILWMRNGFKQPTNATLLETSDGSLRVEMTRSNITVSADDLSSTVTTTATAPQLSPFGERLVTLTWTTNGMRVFLDGSLIGTSSAPSGAFQVGSAGFAGKSAAGTNEWNGHIAAAYLGDALTDDEVGDLPEAVGPPNELDAFKSLATRAGTEGEDSPIPLKEVVWSPRFVGDGIYPYVATNKAKEFHATASLWVYLTTNDTRVAGLKAVTPLVGAAFNPSFTQTPSFITNANALMVDFVTGQSIKPYYYTIGGAWSGCANRPLFKSIVESVIDAYYALGINDVQMDDPSINYALALPFLSYTYGTGTNVGTISSPARGCFCPDCQAAAIVDGYGTLTTSNLRNFHTQTTTNFWTWLGGKVRENSGMRISANLGTSIAIRSDGYQEGRFHYPIVEATESDSYPDAFVSNWKTFNGRLVSTFAVNTQSTFEEVFGASDRTRRWMAGSYAMGFLPVMPWDVYAGASSRAFAARQDIVDISGFVRSIGSSLLEGFSLAGAIGGSTSLPANATVAAWASDTNVLVTVRYRASDGKRVVHVVDTRNTPLPFTLRYYTPIVGYGAATIYKPATYNEADQDIAVATGNFSALSTSSSATITVNNSVASISMDAGLWRIIEVTP